MKTLILYVFYRGHKSYITTVSVFDKYVFTGGADARIKKWDLASCRPMFTYLGHNSKIHKLLVTENLVFSTSHDKTAKVWHTRITKANHTRACIRTLKVQKLVDFIILQRFNVFTVVFGKKFTRFLHVGKKLHVGNAKREKK